MLWFLLWGVLLLAAAAVLFLLGRDVFRAAVALGRDLAEAGERLAAVSGQLERLGPRPPAAVEPAVFLDPQSLRSARARRANRRRRRRLS